MTSERQIGCSEICLTRIERVSEWLFNEQFFSDIMVTFDEMIMMFALY